MPKTANPQVKAIIRAYIGLLIKFPENISFRTITLRQELLPDDMKNSEGEVLMSISNLREQSIVPTRDNLAKWVHIQNRSDLVPVIDAVVKEVEDEDDHSGVPTYSQFIEAWMQNQSGISASQRAAAIMQEPTADYEDRFRRASQVFSQAMPKSMTSETYSESDLVDLVVADNAATIAENAATGEIGWGMPFEAYRAFFTRFKKREFTTWIAETGVGKTTVSMITAEHHSWKQKIKSNSVLFEMETTPEELGQRQIARHLKIPYAAIDGGYVNLDDPLWKPKVDAFKEKRRNASNEYGHIEIVYCPGWTVDQVTMAMEGYMQASALSGRSVAFWLDNLQRVNWTVYGMRQNEAYELIADRLSFAVRRYPNTHFHLIAQEFDDRVAGSRAIERMSQKMISFRREAPEGGMPDDMPVMTNRKDDDGKIKKVQALDALNKPRYWHRKGDKRSGKGTLEIMKANGGRTGAIEVWFEGALNIMMQDPKQIDTLRKQGLLPEKRK